jgi:hypothetical protein
MECVEDVLTGMRNSLRVRSEPPTRCVLPIPS